MYVCIRYFKALDFVSNNFLANIHQYWMCVFKLSVYMFSLCTHFLGAIFSLAKSILVLNSMFLQENYQCVSMFLYSDILSFLSY